MSASTPRRIERIASSAFSRMASAGTSARILAASGIIRPYPPATLARMGLTLKRWGTTPAGGFATVAARWPDRPAIIDDDGTVSYAELHRRSNALARVLRQRGVGSGDGVALMCRNHRGFVEGSIAISRLGADVLYLNTSFAGPQLADVIAREQPSLVLHDEEFTELLSGAEGVTTMTSESIEEAIRGVDTSELSPGRPGRTIILTSGTTGTPKGAPRPQGGIPAAVSLLSGMPLRQGWRCHIAAPLFHTWGFAHYQLAMLLGTTMVLSRRFDPATSLELLDRHRCQSFVAIPVMLQRILDLPEETLAAHSLPRLEVVASSGSALPGDLAVRWMDRFGDNLYSYYGSTEVAWASCATPADLRVAPDTAGRPPHGTVVRILDESGREVPQGETGRIFVGNDLQIDAYTGGGGKERIDGLMSSGDLGRFDEAGRLYVVGRDDEMIVSGGENVFPKEVEDCLVTHPAVSDAAAVGVPDDDFGQRLRAFVVVEDGAEVTEQELKDWVRQHLARYKVPREIVTLPELPRNVTGKVLKRELTRWPDGDPAAGRDETDADETDADEGKADA